MKYQLVQITLSSMPNAAVYAPQSAESKAFIMEAARAKKKLPAKRVNMNFYELPTGMRVHVYNAWSMSSIDLEAGATDLFALADFTEAAENVADLFKHHLAVMNELYAADVKALTDKLTARSDKYNADLAKLQQNLDEMSITPGFETLKNLKI